jgi:nitrile hydratase
MLSALLSAHQSDITASQVILRGKRGVVARVPTAVDNEVEGFGHNAGLRRHYYSIVFPMNEVWAGYEGQPSDRLQIEVFESWLEGAKP